MVKVLFAYLITTIKGNSPHTFIYSYDLFFRSSTVSFERAYPTILLLLGMRPSLYNHLVGKCYLDQNGNYTLEPRYNTGFFQMFRMKSSFLGAKLDPRYSRTRSILKRVISRFQCKLKYTCIEFQESVYHNRNSLYIQISVSNTATVQSFISKLQTCKRIRTKVLDIFSSLQDHPVKNKRKIYIVSI